ncbi:MAG: hypothetical protein ACREOO_23720 [bacterium]
MRKYLWDDEIIPHEKAKEVVAESVALFKDNGFGLWAVTFHDQSLQYLSDEGDDRK